MPSNLNSKVETSDVKQLQAWYGHLCGHDPNAKAPDAMPRDKLEAWYGRRRPDATR